MSTFHPSEFDSNYTSTGKNSIGNYMARTFLWMFFALTVSFAVAISLYVSGAVLYVFAVPYLSILLLIGELVVAVVLAKRLHKLSIPAATALFFLYAVFTGITFSSLFFVYEIGSMILAFGAAALYFGAMAAYGYLTKADLSGLRTVLIGGLIFLLAFSLLSLFIPFFSAFDRIACIIGIVVFLALTAYDTQRLKGFYQAYQNDAAMLQRTSIYAALQLYLDFINIFLYLLRYMGKRKN